MISRFIDGNTALATPEDPDDLMSLRRIIMPGDRVSADTVRTVKQDREFARPGKGERVKIRISLNVEKTALDGVLDRLRVGGTILESNNESVPHGSHHSLTLGLGDRFTLSKRRWSPLERKLLKSRGSKTDFVLVAIDKSDCGIAKIRGTHLELLPNIYSGASGKRYKTDFDERGFFEQVRLGMASIGGTRDSVVLFGPGQTKRKFANFLQASHSYAVKIVEGIDSGGEDGIYTFTRSQAMREAMSESKLARVSSIIDEVMLLANKKSRRFAMGLEETCRADGMGAVRLLVFSDKAIEQYDQDAIVCLLNSAESKGAETFGVDSSTDLGLRVTGLGGLVALLRFSINA